MTQPDAAISCRPQPSLRQRLIRGGVGAVLGKGGNAALGLGLTMVLARLLAPAEFGLYVLALSVVVFAAEAGQLGMGRAVVRFVGQSLGRGDHERARTATKIALLLGGAGCVLMGTGVFVLMEWGGERWFGLRGLVAAAATIGLWTVAMGLMRLQAEVFRGFGAIGLAGVFGGVVHRIMALTALAVVVWELRVEVDVYRVLLIEVGAITFSFLLGLLILPLTLKRVSRQMTDTPRERTGPRMEPSRDGEGAGPNPRRPPLAHGRGSLRNRSQARPGLNFPGMMRVGLPLMLCSVLAMTISHVDMWATGALCSSDDLAVYGAVRRLMLLIGMLLLIVNAVIPPVIAELHERGEMDRLQQVLRGTATLAGLPALLMLGLIVVAAPWLLEIIYGPYYSRGSEILVLLCVGQMIFLWGGSPGFTLMMTGHQRDVVLVHGISLAYAIGISIMLIPRLGITGTAIMTASTLVLSKLLLVVFVRIRLKIRTDMVFSIRDLRALYHYWRARSGEGARANPLRI